MRRLKCGFPLIVGSMLLVCIGCRVTSDKWIVGTYKAEAPCETITLAVISDHSFVQVVTANSKEINRLTGTWTVDTDFNIVKFRPFLDFTTDGRGRKVDVSSSAAEVLPNGIHMGPIIINCPGSDTETDYVK